MFGKNIPQMEPWFDEAEGQALLDFMKNNRWNISSVSEFEKRLADFTGAKYAAMSVNGTVTLALALLALDIKPGDEVLAPALTMIATPNACRLIGVRPILVDVDPETLCMDLKKAEEALTPKTKAIMYVPLNGRSGDMDAAVKFAKDRNLFLVEDAAQALGSYFKGNRWSKKHLGTFGDFGSFSFDFHKLISTGQGGALVTNNEAIYNKIKLLKDFGRAPGQQDIHDFIGWNFKPSNILALIGVEQFKKIPWRINRKREIYKYYHDNLSQIQDIEFVETDLNLTTPWFVDIFVAEPKKLMDFLEKKGIGTRLFYPAINTQKIYRDEYVGKGFPVAERYGSRGLWLPSSSKLTDEELKYTVELVKSYYA
ncbi:hypothetical protein A3G55_00505 [Candidatus Giovannonibacteria bacterium RIFCSPLOWO2_12_FULL_44_25]|uniref:DegT/DnrJ/EryC1/StrS aminotransferase family protein n=3 Tax=Parcubacteria group TaxID=1794811 RepID=A0A837IGL1_9BACT|nr:MAG: DegT/DnrJ/EryC1/StrS aminotransferase family protein [Parcubacteria group bacterium GW2011_GWC1_44_10]KKT60415.1 MAG: DegT/DnrJ/EryC1/StrS aminotransferase family protein [Candidatus Giovannonibacteria bacterium GW2011_GWA1_44_25]KKU12191.1 MAG: DegT/DnrJ/EryC1/StrS aminotransferase family protein [Candidatus Azambacteria bacterium GW2011_GWC2_45_7b]KKU30273.1 MAG: DegT/DnrJ/EryC1/StrS aminotransferase family protein [Candidatus Giovannonibacteria bacterium GW2011_GWB1_46_20]OGF50480.1 